MVVSTLRVMSQRGEPPAVIAAFTFGVVLIILFASSALDNAKKKRLAEFEEVDAPKPSFPVPSIPSTHELSQGN